MKVILCLIVFVFTLAKSVVVNSAYPMIGANPAHNFQSNEIASVDNQYWDFPASISLLSGLVTARLFLGDSIFDLVIFADTSSLYCLRSDGQIYWQRNLPAPVTSFPALDEHTSGRIIVCAGESLISCELESGSRTWATRLKGRGCHPTIWHQTVYITDDSGLSAYDLTTGSLRWRQSQLGGGLFNTTATVDSLGWLYIGTLGNQIHYYDWKIYSFDSLGGLRWVKDYLAYEPGGIRMTMVLLSVDKVVHHNYFQQGWGCGVYAVSARNILWRYGPIGFQTFYSSIAFDKSRNRLYFGTNEGLLVLDTLGNFIDKFNITAITYSSPLIDSAGKIIVGTDLGDFYIFDPSGQVLFFYPTCDGPLGSPAIGENGDIYIAGRTRLYCFNSFSGVKEQQTSERKKAFQDNKIRNIAGQEVKGDYLPSGIYFQKGRKMIVFK